MARVNVEQAALTDPRFNALGKILGVSRHDALGRMCVVWNMCQERGLYVLEVEIVNHLFDDVSGFAEALLKSGLGKKRRRGIYLRGTEGRIEWLTNKRVAARNNGPKGGRPKKTNVEPMTNQDRFPPDNPPALALAPAPAPTEKKEKTTSSPKKIPEPFVVEESVRTSIAAECPGLDIDREHRKLVDWAKNGKRKLDWVATWRNWMRKAWEDNPTLRRDARMPGPKTLPGFTA